jgi:GTP-binding protein
MNARSDVRNIAIIAHVDHGKTTLVDGLLQQAGAFRRGEVVQECALDSNPLERERGITILAKNTAITWKETRINIVDTPGHADFGGEVERVLRMVDSVLLLVDAFEGPMPQTRFVTRKALALGLRPILVVNKIDRDGCDPHGTVDAVFDLFCHLGATDAQLDFPVIFASGRQGFAVLNLDDDRTQGLTPMLDLIIDKVPPPEGNLEAPLCMQVATLDYDDYLGYVAVGRIIDGHIKMGDRVLLAHRDGSREEFRVQKVLASQGLKRFEIAEGTAGDIVAVTGMAELNVGETLTSTTEPNIMPVHAIDEPTISMEFIANNGPFVGQEGKYVTSRNLRERLYKELKSNVALRVEDTDAPDVFKVSGRGELHLSVLIETMRREGFELCVSQPQVIFKTIDGKKCEPYEEVTIDVDEAYVGEARLARRAHDRDDAVGRRARARRVQLPFARAHRLSLGVSHRHARHRRAQSQLQGVRSVRGADQGTAVGRADRAGPGRQQRLRHVQAAGPRAVLHSGAGEGVRRADRRHSHARERSHHQPDQGEAAQQHPHPRRRREADADAAAVADARGGARVHQRRRAGRGHAQGDPAAQADPRSQPAQGEREAHRHRPVRRRRSRRLIVTCRSARWR